jgi:hypothetical protein
MSDLKCYRLEPITNRVIFEMQTTKVVGVEKCVQMVLLALMTSPGSDILARQEGGGIPDLVGFNYDEEDQDELLSEVRRRVSKAEEEVIEDQAVLEISAPGEKLLRIDVLSLLPGTQSGEVLLRLKITNELGQTRVVVI